MKNFIFLIFLTLVLKAEPPLPGLQASIRKEFFNQFNDEFLQPILNSLTKLEIPDYT